MRHLLRKLLTWSVKSRSQWTMSMDSSKVPPSPPWGRPWTKSAVLSKTLALHTTSNIQCFMIKSNPLSQYFQVIVLKNSCQHSRTKDIKKEVQSLNVTQFSTVKFHPESPRQTVKSLQEVAWSETWNHPMRAFSSSHLNKSQTLKHYTWRLSSNCPKTRMVLDMCQFHLKYLNYFQLNSSTSWSRSKNWMNMSVK